MYAITGITGQVGGALARTLIQGGHKVRAVVRSADRGKAWARLGCEVAVADIADAGALTAAIAGTDGVFLMTPPNFDPEPGFPQIQAAAAAMRTALDKAKPGKAVFLSTVGAQAAEFNLLNNAAIVEGALRGSPIPVALLRPGWFMENAAWDVGPARAGAIPSFLQPLDHPIPMVATGDIGETAAALLGETWTGPRVVELEGPARYAANDVAAAFAVLLGHPVRAQAIPRETWEALFLGQGARHPLARMRMLDGFNEGWIDFEGPPAERRIGATPLSAVLQALLAKAP
jgi:NAD(P)H dehydrogenase (quinone)